MITEKRSDEAEADRRCEHEFGPEYPFRCFLPVGHDDGMHELTAALAENAQLLAEVKRLRTNCEAFISGRESQRARADRAEHERAEARAALAAVREVALRFGREYHSDNPSAMAQDIHEHVLAAAGVPEPTFSRPLGDEAQREAQAAWDRGEVVALGVPEPPQEPQASVTHWCPIGDASVTPCCGRTPFELPRTDRMTEWKFLVTCVRPAPLSDDELEHGTDSEDPAMSEFLAHAVGDYVVQSDWMAAEKVKRHGPAALHATTYAACFLPLTRSVRALAVIGGTHFVIDRWRLAKHVGWAKNQAAPAAYRPPHTATGYGPDKPDWMAVWLLIITDNTMHLLINRWALRRWER